MIRPLLLLAIVLASAPGARAEVSDRQSRTVPLGPDARVTLDATIAEVHLIGWDRPEAAIEIVRRVPAPDRFSHLPVSIDDDTPGALAIRVVQADDQRDPALAARITLRLPRTVRIERLAVFEGAIVVEHLAGEVRADLARGPITGTDLAGRIRLETTIGAIDVKEVDLRADGFVKLRTFNGGVGLELARVPRDARIMALALDGVIRSDVPLRREERWGPRFAETSLGRGEPVLSIETTTGDIAIRVKKPAPRAPGA